MFRTSYCPTSFSKFLLNFCIYFRSSFGLYERNITVFMTYRHLAFDLFLPGIVNHSRIRGAVCHVKTDVGK